MYLRTTTPSILCKVVSDVSRERNVLEFPESIILLCIVVTAINFPSTQFHEKSNDVHTKPHIHTQTLSLSTSLIAIINTFNN